MEKCIIRGMKYFLGTDCGGEVHHEWDEALSGDGLWWRSAS